MSLRSDLQNRQRHFPGAHVLDLGCGDGASWPIWPRRVGLRRGNRRGQCDCLRRARSVDVIQGDLEASLAGFADQSFDVVSVADHSGDETDRANPAGHAARRPRGDLSPSPTSATGKTACKFCCGRMPVSETIPRLVRHPQPAPVHAGRL